MASPEPTRALASDKAVRIVEAMRHSVATRGVVGSTFDHVAREAGVSRGLLHYYFGSKERLLVEVARRDAEVRFESMTALTERASDLDELLAVWGRSLYATVRDEPEFVTMLLELLLLAQRTPEIAEEVAGLMQGMTDAVAKRIRELRDAGRLELDQEPETIADVLISTAYGLNIRMLADPTRDLDAVAVAAERAARGMLTYRAKD